MRIFLTSFLLAVIVVSFSACHKDDDDKCAGRDISLSNFKITGVTKDDAGHYNFDYTVEIANKGNVAIDLTKVIAQSYISTDEVVDNNDKAAGGMALGGLTNSGELKGGKSFSFQQRANSSQLDETEDIDGYYVIVHVYLAGVVECNTTQDNTVSAKITL